MTVDVCAQLEPEKDVERRGDGFYALSEEPWLSLRSPDLRALAGRFVEITYRSSLWDEPVRPVFRFWTEDDRFIDRIGAGPVCGAASWIGRVPRGLARVSISPTVRIGPFAFVIEQARRRHWGALVAEGLRRQRRPARSAILTRLIGWGPESDVNLAWAIAAQPLEDYHAWRGLRERPVDLASLDRPRCDWSRGPAVRVFVTDGHRAAIESTLASLQNQIFEGWTANVGRVADGASRDPRVTYGAPSAGSAPLSGAADALTTVVAAGDRLEPTSLALVVERANRHPACLLFYGDEVYRDAAGTRTPRFRPNWERGLAAGQITGYGSFVRGFDAWPAHEQTLFAEDGVLPARVLADLRRDDVEPLHRFVVETGRPSAVPAVAPVGPAVLAGVHATLIIATRDHPALLRRMIDSIRARSGPSSYGIVIVDNGSETPDATALLTELRLRQETLVIDRAGPFNFSAMCNEAAAASRGEVLVFLNDDMEVLSDGWLDRLASLALEPTVGAVGARLTYPDGRLQHVGVLVGMGESAGHFGAPAPADDPGWNGRNRLIHEVSAVTGACLAVERRKFEAVGGFDSDHLPVELSDIDLCLKLNARGWQTMLDPHVHLMHEESVSRGGATLRRLDVYGAQRAVFVDRWRHVLRDDPAFHPGLSLYSSRPALG